MDSPLTKLIKYLIQRPLLVNLLLIFILVLAAVSAMNMQKLGLPRVDMYQTHIRTLYPGASPEDVELNITRKIEEALQKVSDIKNYSSESMENLSSVKVSIDEGTEDIKKVRDDIRQAVNEISDFPPEVTKRPRFEHIKIDDMPIFEVGVVFEGDDRLLQEITKDLADELLQLSHVSRIDEYGVPEKEIRILLNKKQMKENHISFEEVIRAVKSNKIRLSAGSLESYTSEMGIVTFSDFESPYEIGNIILRSNEEGQHIKLKDVATIKPTFEKQNVTARVNGKQGMLLQIAKKGKADIVVAVKQIRSHLEKYKKTRSIPPGMDILVLHDESIETKIRMNLLYSNALAGLVLVLVVLFLFLNTRIAFWTAMSIPIAMGLAFIGLAAMGITINRISILGLVVVLGMLVDDSIIVAESIFRHRTKGEKPEQAAISGVSTVVKPVFATIVTTIIVFVPMYFIPGVAMDFSREIPTFVIAMLIGSLIESLVILPAHLGHVKKGKTIKIKEPLASKLFARLEKWYREILVKAIAHKYLSLLILLGFLAVGGAISSVITKFNMFPVDQSYRMYIIAETDQASSLAFTTGVATKLESIIDELPEGVVRSHRSAIGQNLQTGQVLPSTFTTFITLTSATERTMKAMDVKNFIIKSIEEKNINEIRKVDYMIDGGGPPMGKPIEVEVVGNDNRKRIELLDSVMKKMEALGITEVDSNYRDGKQEIRLKPNYEKIASAQLDVVSIASVIRTAFDGTNAAYMDTADEQIPFRIMLDKDDVQFNHPLKGLYVRNRRDSLVPVKNLVTIQKTKSPQTIFRYNGTRTNMITGNIDLTQTTPTEINEKMKKAYNNFSKNNPGFKIVLKGEAQESSDLLSKLIGTLVVAALAIYFVLIIQFGSFVQPAMVLLAIPFGLVGILLAFGMQGMDLSMLAMIGILGYSGVIVNDSLILVDVINRKKMTDKQDNIKVDIVESAITRLRPILLTTLTTVAGLFPTAYGLFGGFDSFISPMVMVLVWGLAIGTPSVLFVIPVMYVINEDILVLKDKAMAALRKLFHFS